MTQAEAVATVERIAAAVLEACPLLKRGEQHTWDEEQVQVGIQGDNRHPLRITPRENKAGWGIYCADRWVSCSTVARTFANEAKALAFCIERAAPMQERAQRWAEEKAEHARKDAACKVHDALAKRVLADHPAARFAVKQNPLANDQCPCLLVYANMTGDEVTACVFLSPERLVPGWANREPLSVWRTCEPTEAALRALLDMALTLCEEAETDE